jgi:fermentation-respiration switch protein FrsA (DUF1100 family)
VIFLEVLFLAIFWTWTLTAVLFLRKTLLARLPMTATPAQFNLPAETVRFHASDGASLEGWKIPGKPSEPWILCCHGAESNRCGMLEIAGKLHQAGFNLFLFDFRGHGGSAGRTTSFGYLEQHDLEGALVYLSRSEEIPARPYGVYAVSMGAAVALMLAAKDERLGALVLDSPYAGLEETLSRQMRLIYPLPRQPFSWFLKTTYRFRFGVWPSRISPQNSAAYLGARPLLVIHGGNDPLVPVDDARRIIAAASGSRDLWTPQDAGHLESYKLQPEAYMSRLVRFFQTALVSGQAR